MWWGGFSISPSKAQIPAGSPEPNTILTLSTKRERVCVSGPTGKNSNHLTYPDTTLMVENEEELKSLLRVKEES